MAQMVWKTSDEIVQEKEFAAKEAEHFEKKQAVEKAIMFKIAQDYILSEDLSAEEKDLFTSLFDLWTPGVAYEIGEKVAHNGSVYEVIQAHTAQSDWQPDAVPALYKVFYQVEESSGGEVIPNWVQPTGAHDSYDIGDKVAHNDEVWVSTADGNTWEPGVYGWDRL